MKRSYSYILILLAAILWCGSLVVPPIIASVEQSPGVVSQQLYKAFAPICHQDESRSLHLFGHKLAVCSRCSSIYGGFLIGILLVPMLSRKPVNRFLLWFIVGVLPMLLDVALDMFGIHMSTYGTRIITGSFFGIVSGLLLTPSLEESLLSLFHLRSLSKGVPHESKA